jgi:hypothetical protein
MLGDCLIGIGSSTFTIKADKLPNVKRDAAKLKAGLTFLYTQDGVFRPWVGKELSVGLMMAVRKSDAARIKEEKIAITPDLLGVGMAAG